MATNGTPWGCGPTLDPFYYNLCDLGAAWGVVLEALAAAGLVFTFVALVALLAGVPFTADLRRRGSVPLHAGLLVATAGLFGLTFAFIVREDLVTCASRRFLFGVLFGGAFSCLLLQSVRLNVLVRRDGGPRPLLLCMGALAVWLVEVIVNAEWLVITWRTDRDQASLCDVANADFAMALIFVMTLMLATFAASLTVMVGKFSQWKQEGACILVTTLLSICIWVAWISMYVHGNTALGRPTWDDPTLAVALVANAWVFLVFYSVPQTCCSAGGAEGQPAFGDVSYPNAGVGYETILKEHSSQNMFLENKAFSMEEPGTGSKPVSPYSGYTGQLRSSVYQPTELALITKATVDLPSESYDTIIPRASAIPPAADGGGSAHPPLSDVTYLNGSTVGRTVTPTLAPPRPGFPSSQAPSHADLSAPAAVSMATTCAGRAAMNGVFVVASWPALRGLLASGSFLLRFVSFIQISSLEKSR